MAKRDVELIVRAKDEASRALASIAAELDALRGRQEGAAGSSKTLGASLVQAAGQMAKFEQVTGLVVSASERAEAAMARQRAAMSETAAQLASVTKQMENAKAAVDRIQTGIVSTRLAGGDTTGQVAALVGANAELKSLETQQRKLSGTVAGQQSVLAAQERSFREIASMANSAEAALASFGDESQRAAAKSTAAADQAAAAFREQAAAAREAVAARDANARISTLAGVRDAPARSASESASVFQEAEAYDRKIQSLLDKTNPLAAIQRQLAHDIDLARTAMSKGTISAEQFAKAEAELTRQSKEAEAAVGRVGRGENGPASLFGLKPYELTNLGYQVNDLVTQIASGTPILQAFAQQFGQIFQLLPGLGGRITAAFTNPYIIAAAVSIGVFAAGVKRASDNAERLKKVEGLLLGIADGAKVSAAELSKTVAAIERIGVSAEDALSITREFISRGLDVDQLKAFTQTAKDVADATGVDLKDAVDQMEEAFTSGYKAVAELDDKMQFLTVSEREEIRTLFESGRATEARTRALRIYQDRMQDVADKSRSEWADAVDGLERAFHRLMDRLADTGPIKNFTGYMSGLVRQVGDSFTAINDMSVEQLDRYIQGRLTILKSAEKALAAGNSTPEFVQGLRAEIAEAQKLKAELEKPLTNLNNDDSAAQKKRDADRLRDIKLDEQSAKTSTAAARIKAAGEKAYNDEIERGYSITVALEAKRLAIAKQRKEEADKAAAAARKAAAEEKRLQNTFVLQAPLKGKLDVTSGFSLSRKNPVTGKVQPHLGTDFRAPVGTPVFASGPGVVAKARETKANGKYIVIDHGNNTTTTLLHLSDNNVVAEGDIVQAGQLIGKSGNTGNSTGPHLDFRTTVGGKQVDPLTVIGTRVNGSAGEAVADQVRKQDEFNRELDQDIERRQAQTAELEKQSKLSGLALLDAQRDAAIRTEMLRRQQDAADKGIVFDREHQAALEASLRAEWEVTHARERATAAIDDSSAEHDALLERIELARQIGDTKTVEALEKQLSAVDKVLLDAIDGGIKFWQAMGDNPAARAAIQNLRNQKEQIRVAASERDRVAIEAPVTRLQGNRQSLMEQIDFFRQSGQASVVEQLTEQLRALDAEYLIAIDRATAWWQAQNRPDAQAAILNLQNLRNELIASQNQFAITGGQIRDAFAGSLTDSFKLFAQKLVETKDVLGSLGQAVLSFAASFIQKIAEMGLQALAFKTASKLGFGGIADGLNGALGLGNSGSQLIAAGVSLTGSGAVLTTAAALWQAVTVQLAAAAAALAAAGGGGRAASGGGYGGILGGVFDFFKTVKFHEGGVAGMGVNFRPANPAWFANAVRYHGGGIAGLAPDEVPAILRRGEEVLTTADRRHRANAGNDNAGGGSLSQILAIGDDEIASAMAGVSGDRVRMTWLRRNRETIRQELQL